MFLQVVFHSKISHGVLHSFGSFYTLIAHPGLEFACHVYLHHTGTPVYTAPVL